MAQAEGREASTGLPSGRDTQNMHAWRAGWVLTPAILSAVESTVGHHMSFDMWTAKAGFDDSCNLLTPVERRLQSANLDGHTVLLLPSTLCEMQAQLAHYRSCKW